MTTTTKTQESIGAQWGGTARLPALLDSVKNKSPLKRGYKCGSFSLVSDKLGIGVRLRCKKWACPVCGRRLAKKWARRIRKTQVERLLTLTIDPAKYQDPMDAAKALCRIFGKFAKRVRRRFKTFEYLTVVEWTQSGWPHLHAVTRGRYMDQQWISQTWDECGGGKVVDIRAIHHPSTAARYVLKYLTKQLETDMPPHFRRIRVSGKFFEKAALPVREADDWHLDMRPLEMLKAAYEYHGFTVEMQEETISFRRPTHA